MSRPVICEPMPERPIEHPAVDAWSRLGPKRVEPEAIERLKRKSKSAVYRLRGVGPDGSNVIAKRCLTATAQTERAIYEECLPCLPVASLRSYGFLEDPANPAFSWLFLEDASGQEYSPDDAGHRISAARWLAAIHTCRLESLTHSLPDRGPSHYLKLLRGSRAAFVKHLANPALAAEELATLRSVAHQFDLLESQWADVEAFCDTVPRTLVHGDLVPKNVRLTALPAGFGLFVFDWEYAGWGVPATDLCRFTGRDGLGADLATYEAVLADSGRRFEFGKVRQLAQYGTIFRVLDNLAWALSSLTVSDSQRYLVKPISHLSIYERQMTEALRPVEWRD